MAHPPTGSGGAAQDVEGRGVEIVALVTSAGGLDALSAVLRVLPRDFPAGVVVTQHLGGQGSALVDILARRSALPVRWAREGARIEPGTVTVCPSRSVLEVLPDRTCAVHPAESVLADRPLDALLRSVGDSFGAASLAVVLTGMGSDGAAGAAAVRAAGGRVIAQSEDTAEQPSMPAAAAAAGAVDLVLPLHEIGATLVDVVAGQPLPVPGHEAEAIRRTFGEDAEIARLAYEIDWAATPLGAVSEWAEAQRAVVRLAMDSPNGVTLFLGPDHILLNNGAAIEPIGGRDALVRTFAQPYVEAYPETVVYMLPLLARVLAGEHVRQEGVCVPFKRRGRLEDVWWDFNFTPIRSPDGTVLGVYQAWLDRTEEVVGRRRLHTLSELAVAPTERSRNEALEAAVGVLTSAEDVPFAAAYLLDPARMEASLVAVSGTEAGSAMAPHRMRLAPGAAWPLHRVVEEGSEVLLADVAERFRGQRVTDERLRLEQAVLHPLRDQGADGGIVGIVLLGVLPTAPLDDGYRGFLTLVGETVGAKVHEAHARQRERDRLQRLADLDRAKTEFFSNVSHEFRTPLTLMLGPLEELDRDGLTPEQRADLDLVRRNARRLQRLVGTMLDFSQIEAGRLRATFAPVDLAERTRDIVAQFDSAARSAGVGLEVDLAQLPEPVWVDVEMWEKIVSNLLSNALKFTFDGHIAVTLRALPKHAELVVRDTGVGIPGEELPHVFKRFHRVRGTRARTHEGAGIGLALVDELVRRHHGRVRVASTVGEGTTFTVWIPLGRRPERVAEAPQSPAGLEVATAMAEEASRWGEAPEAELFADADAARHPLGGYAPTARVLVVDDSQDMRNYLARLLAPHWELETAADGAQALALARRTRPDLVLADVMMPGLDGFALLRELRGDPALSGVSVVLVTARAGEESAIEGLLAGADDYIVKPFSARELVARVGGQLELARARRRNEELNAFLVRFSDAVRDLVDPAEVATTACRMVRDQLGVDRAYWSEADWDSGDWVTVGESDAPTVSAIAGRYPMEEWQSGTSWLLEGRANVVDDVQADPRLPASLKETCARLGMAANLAVPVLVSGTLRCVLAVDQGRPRRWSPDEIALLDGVAVRCWGEVERARAESTLRESEKRQAFLLKLSDTVRPLSDPVEIQMAACRVLGEHQGVEWVQYGTLDLERQVIVVQEYYRGKRRDQLPSMAGEWDLNVFRVHAEAWLAGRSLVIEDSATDPALSDDERAAMLSVSSRSLVSTPLFKDGAPVAVMATISPVPRTWSPEDVALLEETADRTWEAVERARAEAAVRASEEGQRFLLGLDDALRPLTTASDIMSVAARLVGGQLGVNRAFYAEIAGDDWIVGEGFVDGVEPLIAGRYAAAEYGRWTMDKLRQGVEAAIEDTGSDPRLTPSERAALQGIDVGAVLGVPLVRDGRIVAVLSTHSRIPRQWTESDIGLVREVAARTWPWVERARVQVALRESEARFRALAEMSSLEVAVSSAEGETV